MVALVIAAASPLTALARVNGVEWLRALFGEVVVTDVVLREVLTGRFPATEDRIQAGLNAGWLQPVVVHVSESALPDLDEGEAASIRLALERCPDALLLIDERAGRAVFAELHASDFRIAPAVIQTVLDRCGD